MRRCTAGLPRTKLFVAPDFEMISLTVETKIVTCTDFLLRRSLKIRVLQDFRVFLQMLRFVCNNVYVLPYM